MSGEKEALLGMVEVEKYELNHNVNDIVNAEKPSGYLDFGGNSIQPSFFISKTEVAPTASYEDDTVGKVQLNSFLNYGADAVANRLSLMYQTHGYEKVCELDASEVNVEDCTV